MYDLYLFATKDLFDKEMYYTKCLSELMKMDTTIAQKIIGDALLGGRSLITHMDSKEKIVELRDKLILFGMKTHVCPIGDTHG